MSKKKVGRKPGGQKQKRIESQPNAGRRKFVLIGAGALAATGLAGAYKAGWFGSSQPSPQSSS
ncbi:MAG: hypothetical protein ACREAM_09540, partial [Blastocatellia bacterium]